MRKDGNGADNASINPCKTSGVVIRGVYQKVRKPIPAARASYKTRKEREGVYKMRESVFAGINEKRAEITPHNLFRVREKVQGWETETDGASQSQGIRRQV